MRFAELTLERYGRFQDCKLDFGSGGPKQGAPDLHLIQGANEAGKTTTLAAASDLLFGFGPSSPYNFLFDYPLLRVGAVLEDDGRRLACRRRKARTGSLVDAAEAPIDEGELLAMLRGQTREIFHAAFSLDHARLRKGGHAIVQAQDDLGRALFAAASGMVGVSDVLSALKGEADAIWAPRASGKRLYTAAEREWQAAAKLAREAQVRPKEWEDARRTLHDAEGELTGLTASRDELSQCQRELERLRRIGPAARRRAELRLALDARSGVAILSPQEEAAAAAALTLLDAAERDRATADRLLAELDAQAASLIPDEAVTAEAAPIDRFLQRGAEIDKARRDGAGLAAELAAQRTRRDELAAEFGSGSMAEVPSRLLVAELREVAVRFEAETASVRTLRRSIEDLEARAAPVRARLADAVVSEDLQRIVAVTDEARALGADFDQRCAQQVRLADRAEADASFALQQLAPWTGGPDALASLPWISDPEIEAARTELTRALDAARAADAEAVRLGQESERIDLDRDALAGSGQAIPAEDVHAARSARDALWCALRDHLRGAAPLGDPGAASLGLDQAIADADGLADRRFLLAEASGRLTALATRAREVGVRTAQARADLERALATAEAARQAWAHRLNDAGLPCLEPLRLRAWLQSRADATALWTEAARLRVQADLELQRRADVRRRLADRVAARGPAEIGDLAAALSPLLVEVEQLRRDGEAKAKSFGDDKSMLRGIEQEIGGLCRRLASAETGLADLTGEWERRCAAISLTLAIVSAAPRLGMYEQMRSLIDATAELQRRIDAIADDDRRFDKDVRELATRLGVDADPPAASTMETLKKRLAAARAVASSLAEIGAARSRRDGECRDAAARRNAALAGLAPAMARTGAGDPTALPAAIEASQETRRLRHDLAASEREILAGGDGYALLDLIAAWEAQDPDQIASQAETLGADLQALNGRITEVADATGAARKAFAAYEAGPRAADAAADAEQARAEMDAQAEDYLLRRTQAVLLRWMMERYRERRQNPLLARAGDHFRTLTLGRYVDLRIDHDSEKPRLLGLCEDGATLVDVTAMSDGTTDQLFLALRLAAVEQSVAAGVRLPFLADDLFVNFDDGRANAGFRVLTELARSTQVLFFTHHAHLVELARDAAGGDSVSIRILSGN